VSAAQSLGLGGVRLLFQCQCSGCRVLLCRMLVAVKGRWVRITVRCCKHTVTGLSTLHVVPAVLRCGVQVERCAGVRACLAEDKPLCGMEGPALLQACCHRPCTCRDQCMHDCVSLHWPTLTKHCVRRMILRRCCKHTCHRPNHTILLC
jgi:hypothetical protein